MKKLLIFFLCLVMVTAVCGCSNDVADNSSGIEMVEYEEEIVIDKNTAVDNNSTSTSVQSKPTTSTDSSATSQQQNTDDDTSTESNKPIRADKVIDYNTIVEVDICDDIIRGYLDSKDVSRQYFWLNEYSGGNYDYQSVDLDWDYDGSTEFTVTISQNSDFSNAYTFVTNSISITSTIFVPGKTYYWKVTGNITGKTLGGGKIKIKDAPVRWVQIEGSGNVRDMGGWKTESGKTVKYEMLYRGKALDGITDAGKKTVEYLGFKTEIDIRNTGNKPNPPTISGMKYSFLNTTAQYDYIFKTHYEEEVKNNYKEIFELLSDKNNYPIFTHCSAGADRTGTYAFILNGLLGVSYEDLTRDFELTSFSSSGKRWRGNGDGGTFAANDLEMKVEGNHVAWGVLYKEMMEKYGTDDGKLSSAIENYLISYIGVPKAQIDSFKAIMLE